MINIIIFGHQPLASWVADTAIKSGYLNVTGVVSEVVDRDFSHHKINLPPLHEYALDNGIPILNEDELDSKLQDSPTLGLTVRWPKIIKNELIQSFKLGILNFHGGFLPRWRGLNIPTHIIMEGEDFSGATLHYLDERVDTGAVLAREKFAIKDHWTAYDIFIRTQTTLQNLFLENLDKLVLGKSIAIEQIKYIQKGEKAVTYASTHPQGHRAFSLESPPEALERAARAFEFPGYERAYIEINKRRIYLTPEKTSKVRSSKNLINPFKKKIRSS